MDLNPKKIQEDLEEEKINKSTAVDLLVYLIGNSDNIEIREESLKIFQGIGVDNDKVFSLLEDVLVSDPNKEIREFVKGCWKWLK